MYQTPIIGQSDGGGDQVSVEDLQSQVDEMKRIYDKLAKDLNHKPFDELELVEEPVQKSSNDVKVGKRSAWRGFILYNPTLIFPNSISAY